MTQIKRAMVGTWEIANEVFSSPKMDKKKFKGLLDALPITRTRSEDLGDSINKRYHFERFVKAGYILLYFKGFVDAESICIKKDGGTVKDFKVVGSLFEYMEIHEGQRRMILSEEEYFILRAEIMKDLLIE